MFFKTKMGEYLNLNKILKIYIEEQLSPNFWKIYYDGEKAIRQLVGSFKTKEEAEKYIEKILEEFLIKEA